MVGMSRRRDGIWQVWRGSCLRVFEAGLRKIKQDNEKKKRAITRKPMRRRWAEMEINNMEGRQKLEGERGRARENQSSGGFRLILRHTSHSPALRARSTYILGHRSSTLGFHQSTICYSTFVISFDDQMALRSLFIEARPDLLNAAHRRRTTPYCGTT